MRNQSIWHPQLVACTEAALQSWWLMRKYALWANYLQSASFCPVVRQVWKPQLGAVELSLSVGGTRLDLTVTPLQATLLLHFRVSAGPCTGRLLTPPVAAAEGAMHAGSPSTLPCASASPQCTEGMRD